MLGLLGGGAVEELVGLLHCCSALLSSFGTGGKLVPGV